MDQEGMALVKGAYLGDVTALCFLRSPQNSTMPMLLAGTGAQVDCYDLTTGKRHFSQLVFDGVRVHGLHCLDVELHPTFALVAVHGEGRVKMFKLICSGGEVSMEFWQAIPRLSKWILDVRIIQGFSSSESFLAAGLSDNSVLLWSFNLQQLICRVQCSVKCLLYSMRLWGNSIETLRIAAGTIFNEVLVWNLGEPDFNCDGSNIAKPTHKFSGHEGSIYRIAWSDDGLLLGSVSDDRSARIWKLGDYSRKPVIVLFGHAARVWDLHIAKELLVTASEDCTCRVWGSDGSLLNTLRGHVGRAIWRCLYDSQTAVLVTAGADASMKLYSLSEWASASGKVEKEMEQFHLCFSKIEGSRDSKSEYVRCISLVGPSSLYIGTNQGLIRFAELLTSGDVRWFNALQLKEQSPIVCMDVYTEEESASEFVASGDGRGYTTVMKIARTSARFDVLWTCTWLAESERQLLGAFWCKKLGSRFIFTTDPKGGVRCWLLQTAESGNAAAQLVAYFRSPLSSRIVCLDASFECRLLVCGDQRGNLAAFIFPENFPASPMEVDSSHVFKGAHGVSAAASVSVSSAGHHVEVVSTGRDGCICKLGYDARLGFSCSGVEKVAAITVVEDIFTSKLSKRRIAAGFAAADFLLWDLTNGVELRRTACGGWRRPHSYHIGPSPETQYCFAYLKEQSICVCRSWAEDSERTDHLQSLQKPSHGREIHTVAFIPDADLIISGSEDGSVQITRYAGEKLSVCTSLEEQAAGSAIRAVALVTTSETSTASDEESVHQMLLFSAGAKESLTCWQLGLCPTMSEVEAKWLSTYASFRKKSTHKDDLRCMAITAFAGERSQTGSIICFLVIAMSNATLAVKAFDTLSKTWRDVGALEYLSAPVLSLDHAVLSSDDQDARRFFVCSGATDGTIAVWDLTKMVTDHIATSGKLPQVSAELRPRSGRGSQGGKRHSYYRSRAPGVAVKTEQANKMLEQEGVTEEISESVLETTCRQQQQQQNINGLTSADAPSGALVRPVLVRTGCHQSGVNSLRVCATSSTSLDIVSGGDDQALLFTRLAVRADGLVEAASEQAVQNAHSSAVKGVWSDSAWVFSTGLDQRLRCWTEDAASGQWIEACSCVIDVPEAAALHARKCRVLLAEMDPARLLVQLMDISWERGVYDLGQFQAAAAAAAVAKAAEVAAKARSEDDPCQAATTVAKAAAAARAAEIAAADARSDCLEVPALALMTAATAGAAAGSSTIGASAGSAAAATPEAAGSAAAAASAAAAGSSTPAAAGSAAAAGSSTIGGSAAAATAAAAAAAATAAATPAASAAGSAATPAATPASAAGSTTHFEAAAPAASAAGSAATPAATPASAAGSTTHFEAAASWAGAVTVKTEFEEVSGPKERRQFVANIVHQFRARVRNTPAPLPLPPPTAAPCSQEGSQEGLQVKRKSRRHRPDLIVWRQMIKELNPQEKRPIGSIEGVSVGDLFVTRAELAVLRVHSTPRAGIDFERKLYLKDQPLIAVAVVMMFDLNDRVTRYRDDNDNGEVVVYSGQGGRNSKTKAAEDQKLARGNLGLVNAHQQRTPVRLVRGYRFDVRKVYSYDGLYMVDKVSYELGLEGKMVYKFTLKRIKNQAPLKLLRKQVLRSVEKNAPDLINSENLQPVANVTESRPSTTGLSRDCPFPEWSSLGPTHPPEFQEPTPGVQWDFTELQALSEEQQQQQQQAYCDPFAEVGDAGTEQVQVQQARADKQAGTEQVQLQQGGDEKRLQIQQVGADQIQLQLVVAQQQQSSIVAVEEHTAWDFSDNLMLGYFDTNEQEINSKEQQEQQQHQLQLKNQPKKLALVLMPEKNEGPDEVQPASEEPPNKNKRPAGFVFTSPALEVAAKKRSVF